MLTMSPSTLEQRMNDIIEGIAASRWSPVVANAAALALLCYGFAQWGWRLLAAPAPPPTPAAHSAPAVDAGAELRTLLSANLFGQANAGASSQLPRTSLNLELTGVMVRGKNSYALIRIDGADETPVGIGQDIRDGATLEAVYPDRVTLRRGGALESLQLKDGDSTLPEGSIVSGATSPADGADDTRGNDAAGNPEQRPEVASQALVVPSADGGFLVRQVQGGSLYEKLGLRAGDVIRRINGQPVNDMHDVMRIYQRTGNLQQAGAVTVDVVRAGTPRTLTYTLP